MEGGVGILGLDGGNLDSWEGRRVRRLEKLICFGDGSDIMMRVVVFV